MSTHSIEVIDLHFLETPQSIAAFLVHTSAGPILVESGPHSTYDTLVSALAERNIAPADLQAVLLTHIHLDHAAAAWAIAAHGVPVYVHTLGAKHLIAPERLIASATRLYKDDMDRLWGKMQPIDPAYVRAVEDQQVLSFGDTKIIAHYTPGHARHHIAWEIADEVIFTGDVAGVCIAGGPVFAPLPPPDINITQWEASIARLRSRSVQTLFLTHFDGIHGTSAIAAHLSALAENLMAFVGFVQARADWELAPRTHAFEEEVARRLHGLPADIQAAYHKANPPFMSALQAPTQ